MKLSLKKNNLSPKKLKSYKLLFFVSHFFAIFLKNLKPKTYKLQPSFKDLPPNTHNLFPKKLQAKKLLLGGFTLAELLVTISLFVILTTVTLFSSSKFNGSILLSNLAYDVAITIRQAQSFGVNVREVSTDVFDKAYGVHFDIGSTGNNKQFILFADGDGSGTFNIGDTTVDTYNIKRGNKISGVSCVSSDSSCNSISTLDITFLRPNPDAKINNNDKITEATIKISSTDNNIRNIVVNSTGQISVKR